MGSVRMWQELDSSCMLCTIQSVSKHELVLCK